MEFGKDTCSYGTNERSGDIDPSIAAIVAGFPDSLISSTYWFVVIVITSPNQELNSIPWVYMAIKHCSIDRTGCNVADVH